MVEFFLELLLIVEIVLKIGSGIGDWLNVMHLLLKKIQEYRIKELFGYGLRYSVKQEKKNEMITMRMVWMIRNDDI